MRLFLPILLLPALIPGMAHGVEPVPDQPSKTIVFFGGVKTHGAGEHEHLKAAQLLDGEDRSARRRRVVRLAKDRDHGQTAVTAIKA